MYFLTPHLEDIMLGKQGILMIGIDNISMKPSGKPHLDGKQTVKLWRDSLWMAVKALSTRSSNLLLISLKKPGMTYTKK